MIARISRMLAIGALGCVVSAVLLAEPAPVVTQADRDWSNYMIKRQQESINRQVELIEEYQKYVDALEGPVFTAEKLYPPHWHNRFVERMGYEVGQLHDDVKMTRVRFLDHNSHCQRLLDDYERGVVQPADRDFADFVAQKNKEGKKITGRSFDVISVYSRFPMVPCMLNQEKLADTTRRLEEFNKRMREKKQ